MDYLETLRRAGLATAWACALMFSSAALAPAVDRLALIWALAQVAP